MAIIEVKDNQSLADVAVQYLGDSAAVSDIARLNNISVSDTLMPGQILQLPDAVRNKKVVNYYAKRGLVPASGITNNDVSLAQGGIGYMAVQIDFIVS